MKDYKKIFLLCLPPLLLIICLVPYSWINQHFIVKWLGCGCPTIDEFGNLVENRFSANDFTNMFWSLISIISILLSILLSKKIFKGNLIFRVLYIISIFVISISISYQFIQMMMWK